MTVGGWADLISIHAMVDAVTHLIVEVDFLWVGNSYIATKAALTNSYVNIQR